MLVGAWIGAGLLALRAALYYIPGGGVGMDSHAYWLAGRSAHPYRAAPEQLDAFLYSPVFAQLVHPLALLPWPVFAAAWIALEAGCFAWLTKDLAWPWRIPVLLVAVPELLVGNIYGYLGLALALGLRAPSLWSAPLLTKITTGLPGMLWFVVRAQWADVLRLLAVTGLLVTASWALSPHLWSEWLGFFATHGHGTSPWFLLRLGVALGLTVVAARRTWTVALPFAVLLAVPTWSGENKDLAVLLAAVPLYLQQSGRRTSS